MLANWIILTGFEVKENILINQQISCISTLSFCRQSSRMLGNIQPEIWGARWRDEHRYWHTERRLALICPSVPLGWGRSTWCALIRQIEPSWDSSFINWEYVTFEVQLWCMLRRWNFVNPIFYYSTLSYFCQALQNRSACDFNQASVGWCCRQAGLQPL